jgi:isopenicillin N synthase-like dioxygenase
LLSGNNDPSNDGDLQEGFEIGWEELDSSDNASIRAADGVMAGTNVWPSNMPEFRLAILKY